MSQLGLSTEMRRASAMMALDAAGIPIAEVLRDAQARLAAINSYEAEQKKVCEADWARKAEEHVQMQAELEQIRSRYIERMKQNLDAVARDRARFATWLTTKQEASQSITEAADLCQQPTQPAPAPQPASQPQAPQPQAAPQPTPTPQPSPTPVTDRVSASSKPSPVKVV